MDDISMSVIERASKNSTNISSMNTIINKEERLGGGRR